MPLPRRGLLALGPAAALAGCSIPVREPPVPRGRTSAAKVLGIPNERFFVAQGTEAIEREYIAAITRRRGALRPDDLGRQPPLELLAVSGGGEDGAFGAGLLCGWTEHGTRPEFSLVTGVSTGALTAPFAFLGPRYDAGLRAVYTQITAADVLRTRFFTAALWDDAMADNAPLFATISRHLNEAMLADIAAAYRAGRLLMVGTTQLDAQVPVIWNIGAIAASGHPNALELVRRLLLASAAIPGAFPPVMIDVELDGRRYQEMHVDGGAMAQAFLYPAAVTHERRERLRRRQPVLPMRAYVIRNARLDPDWATVDRRTIGIAERAISTMIASSGMNDVMRIALVTERDEVEFRLAFIGRDFTATYNEPFDQAYMRALFDYGYQRARRGYDWAHRPPALGVEPPRG